MRLNHDLTRPVIVNAAELDWVPSPAAGVDRRMLFRVGGEVARATSIVRYAPGSAFPRHTHSGGEEILVLEGTFQDEHGDYPAGCYFRNPPGTSHVPAARDGCVIFVRLWQYRQGDQTQVVRQPGQGQPVEPRPGATSATVLFNDGHEEVRLEAWSAGGLVTVANPRGLEFLVHSGALTANGEAMGSQGWGRLPVGTDLQAEVGPAGATVWLKDAPLLHPDVLAMPG
ncbi:cupin [Pseudoroseomonas deserti]|uniref:Cupin n=1 Tax=Teichococcus deserti TaxID=1817963 RepID=A0A1V2H940_9PROT|nr:cupin domain-containing protein [Pseudoroseomonas deserti]ONG59139.1 cupin [Pseudoroseomonas deserti]